MFFSSSSSLIKIFQNSRVDVLFSPSLFFLPLPFISSRRCLKIGSSGSSLEPRHCPDKATIAHKKTSKNRIKKKEKKPSYEIDRESAHNRRTIYQQITSSSWSLIDPSEIRGLSRPYRLTEEHFNQRIKRDNRKDKGGSGWERDINFFSYANLGFFSSISLHALRNVYGTI